LKKKVLCSEATKTGGGGGKPSFSEKRALLYGRLKRENRLHVTFLSGKGGPQEQRKERRLNRNAVRAAVDEIRAGGRGDKLSSQREKSRTR